MSSATSRPPKPLPFPPPGPPCSFVKRAMHGTRMMTPAEVRESYGRELVNLRNESRYVFLNTLFSVSEAVLYMQVGLGWRALVWCADTRRRGDEGWLCPPAACWAAGGSLYSQHDSSACVVPHHTGPRYRTVPLPLCHRRCTAVPQMVDRLDADAIPQQVCSNSYHQLHKMVAKALFRWGPAWGLAGMPCGHAGGTEAALPGRRACISPPWNPPNTLPVPCRQGSRGGQAEG